MRKIFLVSVLVLTGGTLVHAQGFIPEKDKKEREAEEMALARKLFEAKDSHQRREIRKEMIEKDIIRGAGGNALGDGFSVKAFVWLYGQGRGKDDPDSLNVRLHAVIGLGALESADAREPLITMLNDPSDAIQLRVIQAIRNRSIVRAGKDVVLKLRSPNADIVAAAAVCLADLGVTEGSTAIMIELMVQRYDKLLNTATGDPERGEHHRMIEVLGRACGQLTRVKWSPGPSLEDLGEEIAKFTRWWNEKHLAGLKDPRYEGRKDALDKMSVTADRSIFMPVLEAVVKEFARLQAAANFTEKQQSQQFIVVASGMLKRISGTGDELRPTSSTQEIEAAVKAWQDWAKQHMTALAAP